MSPTTDFIQGLNAAAYYMQKAAAANREAADLKESELRLKPFTAQDFSVVSELRFAADQLEMQSREVTDIVQSEVPTEVLTGEFLAESEGTVLRTSGF
jgi:hypothetical protein